MNTENGRGLRQPALVNEAPSGIRPSGFDPARGRTLTIPVAGRYFDQILAGTKPEEYRLRSPFWHKRIVGRQYERLVLTRGYPRYGGVEGETRLTLPWRGYAERTITHEFFGAGPVEVFAIRTVPHDSDGPRMAETPQAARGEAGPARAAEGGIARDNQP